jgi:hypothetical protein
MGDPKRTTEMFAANAPVHSVATTAPVDWRTIQEYISILKEINASQAAIAVAERIAESIRSSPTASESASVGAR